MKILSIFVVLALVLLSASAQLVSSGLILRLESDSGITHSSGSVASWADQSGLNNNVTAFGAVTLTGTTPSGLPLINLDGTTGKLERTTSFSGAPLGASDRSIFVVAKYNSTTWWAGTAYGNGANNQAFGILVKHPTGELVLHGWGGGNDLVSSALMFGSGLSIQCGIVSNNNATLYKDGVSVANFAHTYDTTGLKFVIGQEIANAGYVGMDVSCVLIYNRALTTTERQQVESYLINKYFNIGNPPTINTFQISNLRSGGQSNVFHFNDSFYLSAQASDDEDGVLTSLSHSWYVEYIQNGQVSSLMGPVTGTNFVFTINQANAFVGDYKYIFRVVATDSDGQTAQRQIEVLPELNSVSVSSSINAAVSVAGAPALPTPFVTNLLVGGSYTFSAQVSKCITSTQYNFSFWSVGPSSPNIIYTVLSGQNNLVANYINSGNCGPTLPPAGGYTLYTNDADNTVTIVWPYSPNTWPYVLYPDHPPYPSWTLGYGQPDKSVALTVSNGYAYVTTWATQTFFSPRHFFISNTFDYTITWDAHTNASFYEVMYCPSGPWKLLYSVGNISSNQTFFTFRYLDAQRADVFPWNFYVYKRVGYSTNGDGTVNSGGQYEIKRVTLTQPPVEVPKNRPPYVVLK